MPAWNSENLWDARWIAHYRRRVPHIAARFRSSGNRYTCEDLAIEILIRFASYYKLPVALLTGAENFNSQTSDLSLSEFTNEMKLRAGARDLLHPQNSITRKTAGTPVELLRMAEPGDLLYMRSGDFGHIQVVVDTTRTAIAIIQGNFNREWDGSRFSSSNPRSGRYLGEFPRQGNYDLSDNGSFVREGRESQSRPFRRQGRIVHWNFTAWNRLLTAATPATTIRDAGMPAGVGRD